jgi:ribosomal protein L20A (L18A)
MRTSVLSGHEFVGLESLDGSYGIVSVCTCGWRSAPARETHAQRRWEIHVDALRAAASCFAAENTIKRAQIRIEELARLREATRARRAAIHEARGRLASMHRVLNRVSEPTRYARPTMLESARQMAGLSFANLWVAYFSLGGNLSPTELMNALRDSTMLPHWDLNMIALALNEAFSETGLGRPLDYWGPAGESDVAS